MCMRASVQCLDQGQIFSALEVYSIKQIGMATVYPAVRLSKMNKIK